MRPAFHRPLTRADGPGGPETRRGERLPGLAREAAAGDRAAAVRILDQEVRTLAELAGLCEVV
jgi:hypothetical protein